MSDKLFMAFWSKKEFAGGDRAGLVKVGFFASEAGYSDEEIMDIDTMAVMDTWKSKDYGEAHIVTRVR